MAANLRQQAERGDRLVDLVSKWNLEQREADRSRDAVKFDFLKNPGQVLKLRDESR